MSPPASHAILKFVSTPVNTQQNKTIKLSWEKFEPLLKQNALSIHKKKINAYTESDSCQIKGEIFLLQS